MLHDLLIPVAKYFDGEAPEMFADAEEDLIGALMEMGLLWLDPEQGVLRYSP